MPRYEFRNPNPPRHIINFTREELLEALIDFAAKKNIPLPKGKETLWGLDPNVDTSLEHQEVIILSIDEEN